MSAEHFWPPRPIFPWGDASDEDREMLDHETLGPCCNCGSQDHVRHIVMLLRLAPIPGKGWGCVVCDLPNDGAIAVLCDNCRGDEPSAVCVGYPSEGVRLPVSALLSNVFDHNLKVRH